VVVVVVVAAAAVAVHELRKQEQKTLGASLLL